MYDAVLITTHYNYTEDGEAVPSSIDEGYQDLSADIPLGLTYIVQYLHDSGFLVRLLHIPQEMKGWIPLDLFGRKKRNPVEEILKKYPAKVCGIQAHWYLYCGGAIYVSNLYKKLFPDSRVVLGGYMAATCWKEFLEVSKNIDGIILGESEKTIKRILEKSLDSRDRTLENINGLAFRAGNDKLIYNSPQEDSLLGLDEIPTIFPDAASFENISWGKRTYINISRGLCPEKCVYCVGNNTRINTRSYQTLSIDRILEQLQAYQEFGMEQIFLGENHFLNTAFMKELLENITKENYALRFELETHPVLFEDVRLLDKMTEGRFFKYTMGCESGSNSLLKQMGRNSNVGQIMASVKRIVERGAFVLTSWISNLPGESHFQFRETQRCLNEVASIGGFVYWIENLHVFPGSALYEHPKYWDIQLLINNLNDWISWSSLSKKYVTLEEASENPLHFLTHLSKGVSPKEMIERFYSNRKLALSLVPVMKSNLRDVLRELPSDIIETEMEILTWYENEGWKLWLF